MKKYLWTKSGIRLQQFQNIDTVNHYNWIFIPAPGLGSESLYELVNILIPHIRANIWIADYPNDGSNLNPNFNYANWDFVILELANMLDNPILVSHSTGAMLLQSIPELEKTVKGLVWISSAPDMKWKIEFEKKLSKHLSPDIKNNINEYMADPSDNALKNLIISMLGFSFNPDSLPNGIEMVKNLPINHKAANWFDQNFDPTYSARFIPEHIPCLIMGGECDQIIPLDVYKNNPYYCRQNIFIRSIPGASHYPWFDNPKSIIQNINEFIAIFP